MSAATAVAVAVTFVWFGMVLAISFLEAPLKFRAPGVTLHIGLGIGRLVFRALNMFEIVFAVVLAIVVVLDPPWLPAVVTFGVVGAAFSAQLAVVRPRLTRRSNAVLSDAENVPRSHAHHAFVALETLKVLALLGGGVLLLASS